MECSPFGLIAYIWCETEWFVGWWVLKKFAWESWRICFPFVLYAFLRCLMYHVCVNNLAKPSCRFFSLFLVPPFSFVNIWMVIHSDARFVLLSILNMQFAFIIATLWLSPLSPCWPVSLTWWVTTIKYRSPFLHISR